MRLFLLRLPPNSRTPALAEDGGAVPLPQLDPRALERCARPGGASAAPRSPAGAAPHPRSGRVGGQGRMINYDCGYVCVCVWFGTIRSRGPLVRARVGPAVPLTVHAGE